MSDLKTRFESRLQEVATECDEVLEGLNFDALHIHGNNRSDWEAAETKLDAVFHALRELKHHNFPEYSERDLEPDEGPRQHERV